MKAKDTVVTFGKYNGKTLEQIYNEDKDYLLWLACKSHQMRKKAQELYEQKVREEGESLKNLKATFVNRCSDANLNVFLYFKIEDIEITLGFGKDKIADRFMRLFKKDKVRIYRTYPYGTTFFRNNYGKNGVKSQWLYAEKIDIMPFRAFSTMYEYGAWCFNFSPIKPMKKNAVVPIPSILKK